MLGSTTAAIRVIAFDAVGTLIYPSPPVAEVYAQYGQRWGADLSADVILTRFRQALQQQEAVDRASGYRTDEPREWQRWQAIVSTVFHDQPHPLGPLRELWEHFGRPEAWACFPDVGPCIQTLADQGYVLAIASNFDGRLPGVVAGLLPLAPIGMLVVSAAVGWRKPAPGFFAALSAMAGCPPERILLVGDDLENDFVGGTAAGLQTLLLDRKHEQQGERVIRELEQLQRHLSDKDLTV